LKKSVSFSLSEAESKSDSKFTSTSLEPCHQNLAITQMKELVLHQEWQNLKSITRKNAQKFIKGSDFQK